MLEQPPHPVSTPFSLVAGLPVIFPSWHDPDIIGPLMFGTLFQFGFFCIVTVQAVVYFARQGHGLHDNRLFRLYTASMFAFTMAHVAFGVWRIYNIRVLLRSWALLPYAWLEIILNSAVVESVHGFFIFRCYKLSRLKLVLGLILVIALAQIIPGLVMAISSAKAVRLEEVRTTIFAISATTVILDTVISVTLVVNLWRQRTGQVEVDAVILRIIRMTVESIVPCLVCVVFILISVVNIGTVPLGSLYTVVLPLISPLWANALLSALNSRPDFRRQLDSNLANGRISIHDSIQVHSSYRNQRRSHTDIHQLADSRQRHSMSYDIALTNSIEPSSIEGGGLEHTGSKARPVVSGDDPMSALCPEHPTGLSSKQARNSLLSQAEG